MRSLGIYDAVAREDNLVAAAMYFWDDYKEMFKGSVEEYKDYLLERHNFLENLKAAEPVRVVHVPFDPAEYFRWLENSSCWRNGPEARSAWVLDAVKNPEVMERLLKKRPVIPAAPVEEELETLVIFGAVPVVLASEEEAMLIGGRLPRRYLLNVVLEFRRFFAEVPDLQRMSRLRYRGMRLFIGERLVMPDSMSEAEEFLEDEVLKLLPGKERFVPVPPDCRVRRFKLPQEIGCVENGEISVVFCPLMLPVVLVGASADIEYCRALLADESGVIEPVSEILCAIFNEMLSSGIRSLIFFDTAYEIEYFLETLEKTTHMREKAEDGIRIEKCDD